MCKSPYFPDLLKLLAIEYNCTEDAFLHSQNIITHAALNDGRRVYSSEKPFFSMVTLGGNAVITANEALFPFLSQHIKNRTGHWLFEVPLLLQLEKELNRFGYTLGQSFHMFLPCHSVEHNHELSVKWMNQTEITPFYGDSRFPNAILGEFNPCRPDTMAVCAYDGKDIMGMAGCSEDAPGWFQIGIDVMPPYRSRGVGTALVGILKNRILQQSGIPFYGTSISNYHSWNIAINNGFSPAWVEINAKKQAE